MKQSLRIEAELLKRQTYTSLVLKFGLFLGVYILLRIALGLKYRPRYSSEFIQVTRAIFPEGSLGHIASSIGLLLLLLFIYPILIWVFTFLKIKGTVIITPEQIEIIHFKKYHYTFRIEHLKNMGVQFNYFKRNDEEPRSIIEGSNNIIQFKRLQVPFAFEFLLQTIEEDETFRQILDHWIEKGYITHYTTTLAEK